MAPDPTSIENEREVLSPCAAAALYGRSVLREIGGFDEDYFCYVEDVDLGFRLRLTWYRCLYCAEVGGASCWLSYDGWTA